MTGIEARIVGAYYRGAEAQDFVNGMKKGTALYIKPDIMNRYDKNAQAIYAFDQRSQKFIHIGFIEKVLAYKIANLRAKYVLNEDNFLSAKANGYGGLNIEGAIDPKMLDTYRKAYMIQFK